MPDWRKFIKSDKGCLLAIQIALDKEEQNVYAFHVR
jgi:hypothetical protein